MDVKPDKNIVKPEVKVESVVGDNSGEKITRDSNTFTNNFPNEGKTAVKRETIDIAMDVKVEHSDIKQEKDSNPMSVNVPEDDDEKPELDEDTPQLAQADGEQLNPTPREAGFSSENFKIEIGGLPRRFGFKELRKRLSSTLGLRPHKLKALPMKSFAFVCFSCEEDREAALKAINGHVWKGKQLCAKKAQPAADPMKRKHDGEIPDMSKRQKLDDNQPPSIRLKNSVTPLWEMPYEDQLQVKSDRMKEILKRVASDGDVRTLFMKARKEYDGMCCPLLPVTPSPVLESYRNKSEYSIGRSEDGSETVVGFRFGLYKDGTDCVGSPSEISIIPSDSKNVLQSFQEFVRNSKYEPFDHRSHRGHWRQLTVRTTQKGGGILAIVEFVVNGVTQEDMQAEKDAIKKYFTEGDGQGAGVTSFFYRPCSAQTSNSTSVEPYQLIYGDGFIRESLMGMKFRISPSAFFQVNTAAAETLYRMIAEWCNASASTTILDVCCGTGTIGLSMAKHVKEVIGIEMCKEAVEDAEVNAKLNDVTNVKYHCAKVQDVIHDVTRSLDAADVVAVLDPPRAGMNPSVIKCLRACNRIQRIVYAACHPQIAKPNFIDLVRPCSRKMRGEPFKIVRAMPVDMFPHTNFCELLVLFERDTSPVQGEQVKPNTDDDVSSSVVGNV